MCSFEHMLHITPVLSTIGSLYFIQLNIYIYYIPFMSNLSSNCNFTIKIQYRNTYNRFFFFFESNSNHNSNKSIELNFTTKH